MLETGKTDYFKLEEFLHSKYAGIILHSSAKSLTVFSTKTSEIVDCPKAFSEEHFV